MVIDGNPSRSETFTLSKTPTAKEIIELMGNLARFMKNVAVDILTEHDGKPSLVSAANPASNALLMSSATLETATFQFEQLVKQQAGMIAPMPGPRRMN